MENVTIAPPPISTNLAKPKFGDNFNARDKFWLAMVGASALGAACAALHVTGATEFLNPTLPLATDAELNEANYPRFEDTEFVNREEMMKVLSQRIDVKVVCTITTSSYRQVHVFTNRPFDLAEGVEEIEVKKNDDVLPTCIKLIQEKFSNGRARNVTYTINIGNAWNGSSSAPSVGPFEQNDENGNGIKYEQMYFTLGNKWHDNDAIDRLEKVQEDYFGLKQTLRDRDNSKKIIFNRSVQFAKDTASGAINYVINNVDVGFDFVVDQMKDKFWQAMPGGNNEAHPS